MIYILVNLYKEITLDKNNIMSLLSLMTRKELEERILELLKERDETHFDENDDEINVLSSMRESLKLKDEVIDELIDKNNSLSVKNNSLSEKNNIINEVNNNLVEENNNLNGSINNLNESINNLSERNGVSCDTSKFLNEKIVKLKNRVVELNEKNGILDNKIDELNNVINCFNNDIFKHDIVLFMALGAIWIKMYFYNVAIV